MLFPQQNYRGDGLFSRMVLKANVCREVLKAALQQGELSPLISPMESSRLALVKREAGTQECPKVIPPNPENSQYFHQITEGNLKSLIYVCCLLLPRLSRAWSSQLKTQSSHQSPGKLMEKPLGCFPPCLSQSYAEMQTWAQPGSCPRLGFSIQENIHIGK